MKTKKFCFFCCLSALCLGAWMTACQSGSDTADVSQRKEGRSYGVTRTPFKGQWWHYYERALSFSDGCFWKAAESDLREAIRKRNDDKKYARTYGRHFLDLPEHDSGYFPHRELGIALYQQGRIAEAIRELTISLESETSARAELYLDRARTKQIRRENSDRFPPEISLISPPPDSTVNAASVILQGIVRDDRFVSRIRVGKNDIRIDLSKAEIFFRSKVALRQGENRIPIVAGDLSGKETKVFFRIIADRIGPVISIDEPSDNSPVPVSAGRSDAKTDIRLRGHLFDNSGIARMIINGISFPFRGESEIPVDESLTLEKGQKNLEIRVTDIAGNTTFQNIPLTWQNDNRSMTYCPAPENEIQAEEGRHPEPEDFWLAAKGNSPLPGILLSRKTAALQDTEPPVIRLEYFQEDRKHISYLDEIFVEGTIKDNNEVKQLYFNREKVFFRGRKNRFSYIQTLDKDENLIVIRGIDSAGNESRKTIRVQYREPAVQRYESRLSLFIDDFKEKPEDIDLNFDVKEALDSIMFERRRFRVITEEEAGGGVPADCILKGKIRKRKNYMEIFADLYLQNPDSDQPLRRLTKVDVHREHESSQEELIADRELMEDMAKEIHLKLSYEIPLTEGNVIGSDGGQNIVTDLGKETNVKAGMEIIVYRKDSNAMEKDFEELGNARIEDVKENNSKASLRKGDTAVIREKEHVITR